MQKHMQAVRRCQTHAKPRGGDITSVSKDTLAWREADMAHYQEGLNDSNNGAAQGGVICVDRQ